jgi:hypothetical protein
MDCIVSMCMPLLNVSLLYTIPYFSRTYSNKYQSAVNLCVSLMFLILFTTVLATIPTFFSNEIQPYQPLYNIFFWKLLYMVRNRNRSRNWNRSQNFPKVGTGTTSSTTLSKGARRWGLLCPLRCHWEAKHPFLAEQKEIRWAFISFILYSSVSHPDLHGSALILLSWIRIQISIRTADPDPGARKLTKINK